MIRFPKPSLELLAPYALCSADVWYMIGRLGHLSDQSLVLLLIGLIWCVRVRFGYVQTAAWAIGALMSLGKTA